MVRDLRAAELNNLKLALAAFAVQLNAFEARLKRRSFETDNHLPPRTSDVQFARKILWAMKGTERDSDINPRQRAALLPLSFGASSEGVDAAFRKARDS
jgi:hypothetical protein